MTWGIWWCCLIRLQWPQHLCNSCRGHCCWGLIAQFLSSMFLLVCPMASSLLPPHVGANQFSPALWISLPKSIKETKSKISLKNLKIWNLYNSCRGRNGWGLIAQFLCFLILLVCNLASNLFSTHRGIKQPSPTLWITLPRALKGIIDSLNGKPNNMNCILLETFSQKTIWVPISWVIFFVNNFDKGM